jgi:AraC-like DNA-binding protein
MIMVKNVFNAHESYTHDAWVYKDVSVGFSRIYYVIDGEAYYEENGKKRRLMHNHVYLTPVKRPFTLYENPSDKLFHTYSHVVTFPPVQNLIEIEVENDTPLSDAVSLWRKYVSVMDFELQSSIIQLLLSCIDRQQNDASSIALRVKNYLDSTESFVLDMQKISRNFGYSREHITRAFASVYHVTPKQYLNTHRMNIALSELVNGKKIYEVAEEVGFSSQYSFSKAFKKYFGLSPEKYLPTLMLKDIESSL